MNSSLRLMASLVVFPGNPAHLSAMSPVRTDACKGTRLGRRNEKPGQARKSACPAHSDSTARGQKAASLRPATTADRPRRSAGRHPHIRAPAARRHRNAPRMPGIARRQLAGGRRPWAAALQQQGGEAAEVGAVAGVLALFPAGLDAERQVALARADAVLGREPAALFRRLDRRHRRAGRRRRFPAGAGSSFPGSLMARVMAAPPGDCAHAGPVPGPVDDADSSVDFAVGTAARLP